MTHLSCKSCFTYSVIRAQRHKCQVPFLFSTTELTEDTESLYNSYFPSMTARRDCIAKEVVIMPMILAGKQFLRGLAVAQLAVKN